MYRTKNKGGVEYVDNIVNKEPERSIETYSGEIYNYVGNTVDTKPEYLYKIYPERL